MEEVDVSRRITFFLSLSSSFLLSAAAVGTPLACAKVLVVVEYIWSDFR